MTRLPDTASPVSSDAMQSCQVLLFGDLATSFESELRRLLHAKNNATLQSFFEQVAFAFRHEFSQLPQNQQDLFPHFTTLIDLLSKLGETEGTPILKFALLTLCQVGQFIRYDATVSSHNLQADHFLDIMEKALGHTQMQLTASSWVSAQAHMLLLRSAHLELFQS
jgi:hypothetical protein